MVFALTSKGTYTLCGYMLTLNTQNCWFSKHHLEIKFLVNNTISQLYRNVLQQQCNLEQRVLKNALALATHSPDTFAYHIMQGSGYMTLLADK